MWLICINFDNLGFVGFWWIAWCCGLNSVCLIVYIVSVVYLWCVLVWFGFVLFYCVGITCMVYLRFVEVVCLLVQFVWALGDYFVSWWLFVLFDRSLWLNCLFWLGFEDDMLCSWLLVWIVYLLMGIFLLCGTL